MTTAPMPAPDTRKRLPLLLALLAVLVVIGGGLLIVLNSNRTPLQLTSDLPPVLVDRFPKRGEEQGTLAPVVLNFDKPMERESTEQALSISPSIPFKVEWAADDTQLRLVPAGEGFLRDTNYELKLDVGAKAVNGKNLSEEVLLGFKAVGFLEVTQVVPAPDTAAVELDSDITVMFNRPVVPLTAISAQGSLPQPLTFDPPINGSGEWLNTSIYVFRPKGLLQAGATYRATVEAGLSDPLGGLLQDDYVWSFTTQPPQVLFTEPGDAETNVWLDRTLRVVFNQPMNRNSAQSVFALRDESGGTVAGMFDWFDNSTVVFTPTQLLARETQYTAIVAAGAQAEGGGSATQNDFTWQFRTVPPLRIVRTSPTHGETGVAPYTSLQIFFSAPVDEATLDANVFSSVPLSRTDVYTYYSSFDNSYTYGFSAGPSSAHDVTIAGDIADPWGGVLGDDRVVHFETRALDPEAWLNVPGRFGVYNAYTDTQVYASYRNVSQLNLQLYSMSIGQFESLTGPESWRSWELPNPLPNQPTLRTWTIPISATLNERGIVRIPLREEGGALNPGLYLLRVSAPEQSRPDWGGITRHIIVVANTNVTFKSAEHEALVWATDMQSGEPIAGVPINVRDYLSVDLGSGSTGGDGLFTSEWEQRSDPFTTKYAYAGSPGSLNTPFGIALNDWSSGIEGFDFGVPTNYFTDPYSIYMYTERPLYRPGQDVYFKGIVRAQDDARYSVNPACDTAWMEIWDPNGTQVYSGTLTVNDVGTFNGQFKLDEEGALGYYSINARLWNTVGGATGGLAAPALQNGSCATNASDFPSIYNTTFLVSEFRRPEFQVEVTSPKPEVARGETIQFEVQANYFFGGSVGGGRVLWSVLSNDFFFDRYRGPGYWNWSDFDFFSGQSFGGGGLIASGEGVLDDQGHLQIEVPANLDEEAGSQTFSLEATVIDINDLAVSSRIDVVVHRGEYYIGMQPDEYVGVVGQPLRINLLTVDWQGQPFANATLDATVYQREWFNVQQEDDFGNLFWTYTFSDTQVYATSATTTADGEAQFEFTPPEGGQYHIVAEGRDARGNVIRSGTDTWVSSGEYVSWRQENNDRIQLVADKESYVPGDTAQVLVPSPFQGEAIALLTVERGRILEHQLVTLRSNSDVLDIPITADMAPNAFVSVVIVKGTDENNLVPAFRVGYAAFAVDIAQQVLNVTLTPDKDVEAGEHYGPREKATYTLRVTDYQGNPVQAEVSLALTDLAVLSLLDDFAPPIAQYYYGERGLGVRTSTSLVISVDRINITFAEEGKGGGGGGGDEAGGFIRQRFVDTVYWNATVQTDANGEATVSADLADNLTTWRMRAVAVTKDTLVGSGSVDVISTKDLLIRPLTPRFFVVGDKVNLAATANNNTATALDVEITLDGTGIQIDGARSQTVNIAANGSARVEWPATVLDAQNADLTFSARGGGLSDASKPPAGLPPNQLLPIYKYSTPETVGTAGVLDLDESTDIVDAIVQVIALPQRLDQSQGELKVQLDPSLASASVEGLNYLEHYPYECVEQTVSRFLPNVLTYRALNELNLARPELEAKLQELVGTGLQRLYNQQNPDGGWGWWANQQSDLTVSAYVALGLTEARDTGFSVDARVLSDGLTYLRQNLMQTTRINSSSRANRQAFLLYVLAEAGEPQTNAAVSLFDSKRALLSNFGKAYLALALSLDTSDQGSRIDTLLSDLNNAAKLSATGAHWEEDETDYFNWNTDTRSTAIILDAYARLDPQNLLAPNVVRWLMVARTAGRWESTQETAWALIALTDWMKATGELQADYSWSAELNGQPFGSGEGNQESLGDPVVLTKTIKDLFVDQANALQIAMSTAEGQSGSGRLYYTAHLQTFLPVEDVKSLTRGVSVSRQYFSAADACFEPLEEGEESIPCTPVTNAKVGDVLQVRLTIVAPNDLYYVKVEDPFPAGMEAVDTTLKTTSQINEAPNLDRNSRYSPFDGWGWWWFSRTELRDEKAVLFSSYLPRGTYEYTYQIRAGLSGTYNVIPSHVEEMYFPEVFGRSDGTLFTIEPSS